MKERSKGLFVLLASAAAAGVYVEATRDRTPQSATSASAAPAQSAAPPSASAPRTPTRAEVEGALRQLSAAVKAPASDAQSPWALAHGLVAFGAGFTANDGRLAVDVMASFAEPRTVDGKERWLFPEEKDGALVEPHRHLLVKTLLELSVPLEREVKTSTGKTVRVERLVDDLRAVAAMPKDDAEWHHGAWLLSALVASDRVLGEKAPKAGVSTLELTRAALTQLEKDQRIVTEFSGDPATAFEEGSPLRAAKTKKTGIYGHSCGGLHLVQALVDAVAAAKDADLASRLRRQLGILIFRYEAERATLARLLAAHPDQGLLLRTQQLKFFGHLVETLAEARAKGVYDPKTEGGKKLDWALLSAAADVVDVTAQLDRGGVYARLDDVRKQRAQTALDLVGDGCHAVRGLRRLLATRLLS